MNRYSIPTARVVYEVLHSEAIVIDFNTGNYYALVHVAKQVWQLIEKHTPQEKIIQILSQHYEKDLKTDVETFIQELLDRGLIEPATLPELEPHFDTHDLPYEPPKVMEYTDVQNLLLLDPIHEVTEVGWPVKNG
jgi:hypothetical protein